MAKAYASLSRELRTRRAAKATIGVFFVVYSIVTLVPFYFLIIRAFVPTSLSTKLHLWIPDTRGLFTLEARYGNLSYYYRFNTDKFKEHFGLTDYIPANTTFRELAEQNNIQVDELVSYMDLRVRFAGWLTVIEDSRFLAALLRNVLVTTVSIFGGALLGTATGSVLALFRRKWHVWVYNTYLISFIIPGPMVIIPTYIIVARVLNLHNSLLALIILYLQGGALSTLLFTAFIGKMPAELRDSVYVDGGNRMHYFVYVLLPLCKVVFGTFAVISITGIWNDLLSGLLYLDRDHSTLIPMLNAYISAMTINLQAIYAGLAIAVLPLVVVYVAFQGLFVRATFSGALKG